MSFRNSAVGGGTTFVDDAGDGLLGLSALASLLLDLLLSLLLSLRRSAGSVAEVRRPLGTHARGVLVVLLLHLLHEPLVGSQIR